MDDPLYLIVTDCCILLHIVTYCWILLYCYIFCYILSHIVTYCYIYSYKTKTFVSFLIWFCTYSSIRLNSFSNTLVNPSNQTRLVHDEILETNGVLIFLFTNFDRPNNHQSDKTHLFILSQLICLHFQGIVLLQHLPMIANDERSMSVNIIASDTSWLGVTFLADFGLIDRSLPEPSRPRPEPSRPLPEPSRTLPDASRLLPPASPSTVRWAAAGTTEATLAWFGSRLGPRGCEAASLPPVPIDRWVLPIAKSELRGKRRWRFIGITRNRIIKFGLFWIYVAVNNIF